MGSGAEAETTSVRATSEPGWSRTFAAGLGAVLGARLLYLARYGADVGWMNLNYLAHARAIALGLHQAFEERPLTYLALVAARRLGASARMANELVYLVAHLLLAAGAHRDRALRLAGGLAATARGALRDAGAGAAPRHPHRARQPGRHPGGRLQRERAGAGGQRRDRRAGRAGDDRDARPGCAGGGAGHRRPV